MIRFTLLAVGRIRDPHLAALCTDYLERLQHYARIQVEEVRDFAGASPDLAMEREAQELLRRLGSSTCSVALHRSGRGFTSIQLSQWLQKLASAGRSDLTFLIGGPAGLAPSLLQQAHFKLSLSSLTFPHEMARLVLLEQLYRAMTIWRGEPYHRGG